MATKQITEYAAITDMDNAGELLVQVGGVTSKITRANLFASTDTVALGGAATVASTLGVSGDVTVSGGDLLVESAGVATLRLDAATGEDTAVRWTVTDSQSFVMGMDTSAGTFKMARDSAATPSGITTSAITIAATNAVTLGSALTVTGNTTLTGTLAANDNVTVATGKTLTLAGTADIYTAQGTWTSAPAVLGSVGNPTVTYGTRTHYYKKLGNIVFFSFYIPVTLISGGSGDIRIEMPTASVAYAGSGSAGGTILTGLSSLDYEGVAWAWAADASNPFMVLRGTQTGSAMQIAALDSSSVLQGSGFYFI